MKILVLNCGSSSVKYKLLDMNSNEELALPKEKLQELHI